ncbi:hypothetical protein BT63DRAFT_81610 [Microthyrium microscopicum]|uniref:Mediator of RNA polymerase II transcription subunit 6 n=1 Tax=Microthyrium microscopicum TaxID=703497 RepID=A0A6A6TY12_9PEZI|nr:hypothetical protein BT63DRAFT_81610 [Microthyrium microscopicum]
MEERLLNGKPFDEIAWRNNDLINFLNGVWPENVHRYFLFSDFCDKDSTNSTTATQLSGNPNTHGAVYDRAEFERQVKAAKGKEYLVVDGPDKTVDGFNPVWVIRKQQRNRTAGGRPDDVSLEGTYFCVNQQLYQSPSLYDIMAQNLLNIQDKLEDFHTTAAEMPLFNPQEGYNYFSPDALAKREAASRNASVASTPGPGALTENTNSGASKMDADRQEQVAMLQSLEASIRFGGEYMDVNPIVGEPGKLSFQSTDSHLQAQAAARAKAAADKAAKEARSAEVSAMSSPFADTRPVKKGSKAEKTIGKENRLKRRKSKGPGATGSPEASV